MLLNKRIPLKYLIKKIWIELIITSSFILIAVVIEQTLHLHFKLPIAIPAFLGTSISLVLAFKLNQSYDRWWEARKIWGEIVNDSRSLVVQLKNFSTNNDAIKRIAQRQMAWCFILSNDLRNKPFDSKLSKFFNKVEYDTLLQKKHKALHIIDLITADIQQLNINESINQFQHMQLNTTVQNLCASMGKSERIKNTVFPKTYRLFLKLFIYLFISTLIISLSVHINWVFEAVLVILIVTPFLLLEKTALAIQDPFENKPTDTPTTAISKTIEENISELLSLPLNKKETEHNFYIL